MMRLLRPQRLASLYGILGPALPTDFMMRASFSASDVPLNSPHGAKERRFSTTKEPTDSGKKATDTKSLGYLSATITADNQQS
jgi:hypothetical protein